MIHKDKQDNTETTQIQIMPTTVPAASNNAAENFTSHEPSRHTKLGIHNIDLFERVGYFIY
jgi:hypothetical protein